MYFFFIKTILVFLEAQKVLLSETSHYSCRVCRGKDRNRQYRIVRTDSLYIQTQLPQPFPWKRCFDEICKIRGIALVLESHLIKLYVYSVQIYKKKAPALVFSCEFREITAFLQNNCGLLLLDSDCFIHSPSSLLIIQAS